MHCPTCGQQQVSDETRFCSRCGFLLTGVAEVVANNGIVRSPRSGITGKPDSLRRRGIKQGVFIFLLALLFVPLTALIALALDIEPYLPAITALLFVVGGLLRTVYALMFESGSPNVLDDAPTPAISSGTDNRGALPPSQSIPVSAYTPAAGSWRDTNDLQRQPPGSVTDTTTKLLQKEDDR
ncbi:MAG TPA: hypothetical protein VNA22_05785 [Pyrinomonadaceae bacterium]|nr:hypothetical protein [Pyrinomonadaceae bacterium]